MEPDHSNTIKSRHDQLLDAVKKVGVPEAVRRIKSVVQETTERGHHPNLTEHGEIGVSLAAILKINLCQECRFRLRRALAADIRRLEIMRAHMAGEIAGIDSMLDGAEGGGSDQ